MLRLYNTLSRRKEVFKPLEEGNVRMYSCGLTVYDFATIGNLRAYSFVDLLRRWLEYRGFEITHVMNFTDVDDKTIKGMQRESLSLKEYTQKYIDAFLEDLKTLNIKRARIMPKATEHIDEMVKLVEILMRKGYGYRGTDGSIYYNISKFKDYGKLSKMKISKLKTGVRVKVDEYGKDQASDFALWKAWDPADGDVFWETSLGKGRPGWSIECSAMSMKYLGKTLDIHTGGVDNIFPHHENEIAQSEAATGTKFVNYWLHNEHLLLKGERMGKSLKNFYTLRDLLHMGYDPMAIRYLLISTHYRKQLHFTFESLRAARNALNRLYGFMERLRKLKAIGSSLNVDALTKKATRAFKEALDDDLDISKALAVVFNLAKEVNRLIDERKFGSDDAKDVDKLFQDFNEVLGILDDFWAQKEDESLSKEIETLIKKREEARKAQNWKTADAIRNKLQEQGILLEDTPEGVKWKRIRS